jgi:hypothetical protein
MASLASTPRPPSPPPRLLAARATLAAPTPSPLSVSRFVPFIYHRHYR